MSKNSLQALNLNTKRELFMSKNITIKYICILLYIITFIYLGYNSVEIENTNLATNVQRESISWIYLFIFNYSNIMFLIILSFLGGIFSLFSITNFLIDTGISFHMIYLNSEINIFKLISVTMIHGIFEFSALAIVLEISMDIFLIFFRYFILGSNIELLNSIKYYIKKNAYKRILCISFLLLLASILEYFISAKIFLNLGIS